MCGQMCCWIYPCMIPSSVRDAFFFFGQRLLGVLRAVYRLWASVRMEHLRGWSEFWLLESVCVVRWTGGLALEMGGFLWKLGTPPSIVVEECLAGVVDTHVHVLLLM